MLVWNANFQIPNSGVQCAYVYAFAEKFDSKNIVVKYYGDENKSIFIKEELIPYHGELDPYDYLITLDEFKNYQLVG